MTAREQLHGMATILTLVATVTITACTGIDSTSTSSPLDRELLRIDVPTVRMVDRESQFLEIDASVLYRIRDARVFLEKLQDENQARVRIGNFAIVAIRNELGLRVWADIIGGDDNITREEGTIIVSPRVTQDGTPTGEGMMANVIKDIKDHVEADFGVEIVDVLIVYELR